MSKIGVYYGNPAVWYNNIFITLKERNITINKPEDLKGLIVTSFQDAVKRYPKWLKQVKKMIIIRNNIIKNYKYLF